jgi:hypothetical protein
MGVVNEPIRDSFAEGWEDYSLPAKYLGDGRVREPGHGPGQHGIRQP